MSENEQNSMPKKRRAKRFLTPSQKYEIWLQLVRQEVTMAEAASRERVDRSTIVRIRTIVERSTRSRDAASAIVTSWRTSCNQISYFCDGVRNRFARRFFGIEFCSFSDIIRSSYIEWETHQMWSDQNR